MRFIVLIVALLLVASLRNLAAVTSIEDLCKESYDVNYCVTLLKPGVSNSIDFKSKAFLSVVRKKAIDKATTAHSSVIEHAGGLSESDAKIAELCSNKLRNSIEMLMHGDFDSAAQNQEACADSLEDASGALKDAREKADDAAKASRVVNDIYFNHRNAQSTK